MNQIQRTQQQPPRSAAAQPRETPREVQRDRSERAGEHHRAETDRDLFLDLLGGDIDWLPHAGAGHTGSALPEADSAPAGGASPAWDDVQAQLTGLLADRPEQAGEPFNATLMLPNLGEVGVALKQQAGQGWNITLRFARRSLVERFRDSRGHCQQSLANAIGRPVQLEFQEQEDWA